MQPTRKVVCAAGLFGLLCPVRLSMPAAQAAQAQAQAAAAAPAPQSGSRMKSITNAQRAAAAAQARADRVALRRAAQAALPQRAAQPVSAATLGAGIKPGANATTNGMAMPAASAKAMVTAAAAAAPATAAGIPGASPGANSCQAGILDYFNCGNYANSPLPELKLDPATGSPMLDANGNPVPVPNTGLRKFVSSLAGVGAGNKNELGNYIPIAQPAPYPEANGTTSDFYQIDLKRYTQTLHPDLPPTLLQGYRDAGSNGAPSYLGPIIFAKRDKPVRVKFTNSLPSGAQGKSFLPVDITMKGDGNDANGQPYTQNRALLHLHGGVTPWISDGTPHQWVTPAGDGQKGTSQKNVPDMPDPGPGASTWYWTNHQSSRLMWYHDHSYGMTRQDVYAGEAAPYILSEPAEDALIAQHLLPDQSGIDKSGVGAYKYGIPLVIQDKTFVPPTAKTVAAPPTLGSGATAGYTMDQLSAEDPTWLGQTNLNGGPTISTSDGTNDAIMGQFGQLWFPHVFTPNQNPNLTSGVNNYGRWDYGAWVWPPVTGLVHKPMATTDPVSGAPITVPPFPNPSAVQESFQDTPLVNGTPYPTLTVGQKAYRFRILDAANERHWNLQFYYAVDAAGNPCKGGVAAAACTEVKLVPAVPTAGFPAKWPVDGRAGGVPDPSMAGPNIVQIGNEGGLLPAAAVIPSQPVGYEYNRRVITSLNVSDHALLIAPGERADVVVDFSGVPDGAVLILYNDAPAPLPGFDTRLDYYTGDADQTDSGGAPATLPGYGPNTRTVMQFVVNAGADASSNSFNVAALNGALSGGVYASMQDAPLVPEVAYPNSSTTDKYAFIQDNVYDQTTQSFVQTANANVADNLLNMQNKAIAEEFDTDWGRMTAQLGVELPFTNFLTQTTMQMWYWDPPTEIVNNGETQIWKITHNGVDTHSMHFHLFNVQLINRVAWDGTQYPPDANELGWKDSVRMNPLTDTIVALRPIEPPLPFSLPDSYRPLDPTLPVDSTAPAFTNVDPATNNPITVTNKLTNFGWEEVWHCHLLGHEENDMMRSMIVQVPPEKPANFAVKRNADNSNTVSWTNAAASASGFTIQRADDSAFTTGLQTFTIAPSVSATSQLAVGTPGSYTDSSANPTIMSYYRVASSKLFNNQVLSNGVLNSDWSSTVSAAAVPAPIAKLDQAALSFGVTPLKSASVAQILTLSNIGTAPLTITAAPKVAGTAAADFVLSNGCGTTLAAKASCAIGISFAPTAASIAGGRTATLSIGTSDTLHPALSAKLSGTGTGLKVAPLSLAFGDVPVNATATQTFTLQNVGGGTLTLRNAGIALTQATGDYTMTNNCRNNTVSAAGCTVTIRFSPLAAGLKEASAGITTTDPAGTQTVSLTGNGTQPKLTLSDTSLTFSTNQGVASAPQVVSVSNTGTAPLNINSIRLAGTTPGAFRIQNAGVGSACPAGAGTLAVGKGCTVTLVFQPNAAQSALTQPVSAQLDFNLPARSGASQSVTLAGTATLPAAAASPATLTFTRANAATPQLVTVQSTGTGPLSITGVSVSGAPAQFTIAQNNCPVIPTVVAAGFSCTVGVTYTPASAGAKTATLTVAVTGPAVSPKIALSGGK